MLGPDKMSFVIVVRPDKLTELKDRFPADMVLARNNIAARLETDGRSLVQTMLGRWKTGRLASTLKTRVFGNAVVLIIGSGIRYARWVFDGARRHDIRARGKFPLGFTRIGQKFHFWKVDHPGQPARKDILIALKALAIKVTKEEVRAIIQVRLFR